MSIPIIPSVCHTSVKIAVHSSMRTSVIVVVCSEIIGVTKFGLRGVKYNKGINISRIDQKFYSSETVRDKSIVTMDK